VRRDFGEIDDERRADRRPSEKAGEPKPVLDESAGLHDISMICARIRFVYVPEVTFVR
jgi:hypothetical protein